MWQRFTERARKIVFYAQQEAQQRAEGYVSTEHLLLGLTHEEDTTAAKVLQGLGIGLGQVRAEVEKKLGKQREAPSQDTRLTPRAKRTIDEAYREARQLQHNYIGTEHILLGLIHETDGLAGKVLKKLGVTLDAARIQVIDLTGSKANPAEFDRPKAPEDAPRRPDTSSETYGFLLGQCVLEHLMLVALASDDSIANRAIRNAIGDTAPLQAEVWTHLNRRSFRDDFPIGSGQLDGLLEQAHREAEAMEAPRVELHHLILAISRVEHSLFARVLTEGGLNYDKLCDEVEKLVETNTDMPNPSDRSDPS